MNFDHIPNREALGVADNMEAFTPPARRTPVEVVSQLFVDTKKRDMYWSTSGNDFAREAVLALRAAGYDIIQRVSQGNKHA